MYVVKRLNGTFTTGKVLSHSKRLNGTFTVVVIDHRSKTTKRRFYYPVKQKSYNDVFLCSRFRAPNPPNNDYIINDALGIFLKLRLAKFTDNGILSIAGWSPNGDTKLPPRMPPRPRIAPAYNPFPDCSLVFFFN